MSPSPHSSSAPGIFCGLGSDNSESLEIYISLTKNHRNPKYLALSESVNLEDIGKTF